MIIITKIETIEVDRDMYPLPKRYELSRVRFEDGYEGMLNSVEVMELIRGKRFVNFNGKEFVVGWSEQVEDLLELPLSCIDNLHQDINDLRARNFSLSVSTRNFNDLGFWKQLWFILNEEKI